LHEAASNGDVKSIRLLLAAGANPHAAMPDGRTPIDLAKANKHDDAVGALKTR
jgi:ankyrin repeat protein